MVGILTAGVLAAIFGIIPWAQDRSAKQDLAAINTAQGVTYAKDGQVYKDLDGLVGARLVSGLDPEKSAITVSEKGKGFAASITSGSGTTWCITNEDTEPSECAAGGEPGGPLMAVGFCTSNVVEQLEYDLDRFDHPLYANYLRWRHGVPGFEDRALYSDPYYADYERSFGYEGMTEEEKYTLREYLLADHAEWPEDHREWDSYGATAASEEREILREACKTYPGPTPYTFDSHPSVAEWGNYAAVAGSNDPIRVGVTFPFGEADSFDFTLDGNGDRLYGYKSHEVEFEIVDGKPLWTLVLHPVAEGWGHKIKAGYQYEGPDGVTVNMPETAGREYSPGTGIGVSRKGSSQRPGGWGFSLRLKTPAMASHSSNPWETDSTGKTVLRGKSGSMDPIVFGFATPGISNPENLRSAPVNPAGDQAGACSGFAVDEYNTAGIVSCYNIPGFSHGKAESHGIVDGQHYYTYTMWPGESGWGAPGRTETKAFRVSGPLMNAFEMPVAVIIE